MSEVEQPLPMTDEKTRAAQEREYRRDATADQRLQLAERTARDYRLAYVDADQFERIKQLRSEFEALSRSTIDKCPPSRELSLCLTDLDSACSWAEKAIQRNE